MGPKCKPELHWSIWVDSYSLSRVVPQVAFKEDSRQAYAENGGLRGCLGFGFRKGVEGILSYGSSGTIRE